MAIYPRDWPRARSPATVAAMPHLRCPHPGRGSRSSTAAAGASGAFLKRDVLARLLGRPQPGRSVASQTFKEGRDVTSTETYVSETRPAGPNGQGGCPPRNDDAGDRPAPAARVSRGSPEAGGATARAAGRGNQASPRGDGAAAPVAESGRSLVLRLGPALSSRTCWSAIPDRDPHIGPVLPAVGYSRPQLETRRGRGRLAGPPLIRQATTALAAPPADLTPGPRFECARGTNRTRDRR